MVFVEIDYRMQRLQTTNEVETHILTKLSTHHDFSNKSTSFADKLRRFQTETGKIVVLVAIGCEKLMRDAAADHLIWSTIQQRRNTLHQLMFFETNLMDADHLRLFGSVPAFQPRIFTMKLYEKPDVMQFMRHMENEWKFSLPQYTREEIYAQCGGMLLLVKEALWYLRDNPHTAMKSVWAHTEMLFNLVSLWHGFGPREQETLQLIAHRMPITDPTLSQSVHYLLLTGIVKHHKHTFSITIPLLTHHIRTSLPKQYRLSMENDSILLNGTLINEMFSANERIFLRCLINSEGKIVSRAKIAAYLWPDKQENYSDWALDSVISRTRNKLKKLGVSPSILEVQKKHGVMLKSHKLLWA